MGGWRKERPLSTERGRAQFAARLITQVAIMIKRGPIPDSSPGQQVGQGVMAGPSRSVPFNLGGVLCERFAQQLCNLIKESLCLSQSKRGANVWALFELGLSGETKNCGVHLDSLKLQRPSLNGWFFAILKNMP
jgi:hypothetical protein